MMSHPSEGSRMTNDVRASFIRAAFRVLAVTAAPALLGYLVGRSIHTSHAKASPCEDLPTLVLVEVERSTSPEAEWAATFPPAEEIVLMPSSGQFRVPEYWAYPSMILPDINLRPTTDD